MANRVAFPHIFGLFFAVAFVTASCNPARQGSAEAQSQVAGRRLYSVAEQERIALAAEAFWLGASKCDEWEYIARRTFQACGSPMDLGEANQIASYHPRAKEEPFWRGAFESGLMRIGHLANNAVPEMPSCRLIKVALSVAPSTER